MRIAGNWVLWSMMLLGPLLAVGKSAFQLEGDAYPMVRARTVASVVLFTMDEIAPEDLPLYSPELPEDPFLTEFARLGLTIHYAFGAANQTPEAAVSVLTGELPSFHGVRSFSDRMHKDVPTLAAAFDQRGSRTCAITNVPLLSQCGLANGFQEYEEISGVGPQVLGAKVKQWLAAQPEEYLFLWVHYHLRPAERDRRGEVFARLLEEIVEGLKESRKYEGTFLIAAGTHGRPGGTLAVPMLWKIPKRTAVGAIRNGPCSTLDVAASLQEVFGLRSGAKLAGRSLVSPPYKPLYSGHYFNDVGVLFERYLPGAREPALGMMNHKFAVTLGPGRADLGVYETAGDPTLRENRAADESVRHVKDFFLGELMKRREALPPPTLAPRKAPIPAPVQAVLRAMEIDG